MAATTQDLVQEASRGDAAALDELFARYLPELRAFVRLHMGARLSAKESAGDVVQSACREVLQDLSGLEWRGAKAFKQLLFLQARRKIASRGRFHAQERRDAAREEPLAEEATGAVSLLTPHRAVVAREEMARFFTAVEDLPDEQRRVLLLCRGLGMTPSEAAAELDKTANATRVLLHRALARFAVLRDRVAGGETK